MFQVTTAAERAALQDGAGVEGSLGVLYQDRASGAVSVWNPTKGAMQGVRTSIIADVTPNDSTAAATNTAALQALADSLSNEDMSRLEIVFPDGLVYQNGVVNWRCYSNQSTSSTAVGEAIWPRFKSAGTTTIVWTGGHVNGAIWRFQHGETSIESAGLDFDSIRFVGPGMSVYSTAVASSSVGAAATSVVVLTGTGSNFVVGDAIAIDADAINPASSPPWWATVTGVSGDTVSFLPPTCTSFAASVGNRVIRWKQTRAIELGGQTDTRQDIFNHVRFNRCAWVDFFSCVATQDVTGLLFDSQCRFAYCKFGLELGYNNDSTRMRQPWMLAQRAVRSGTVTNGSRVVTNIDTSSLKVGMALCDRTAPSVARAFSEWAVIESIDSASQVTMTHAATLGSPSARNLQPQMGWMVAIGSGVSPWYPREIAPYDGLRTNIDQTVIENPLQSMGNGLVIADGQSHSAIEILNGYIELTARGLLVGNQGGTSTVGPYVFSSQVKQPEVCWNAPLEFVGSTPNLTVEKCLNDSGMVVPFLRIRTQVAGRGIVWKHNNVTSAVRLISPDQFYFNGISPGVGDVCVIDIGGRQSGGPVIAETFAGGTQNIETAGLGGLLVTLNASTTLASPPNYAAVNGAEFELTVISSGSYTLSLGTAYKKQDGSAITSVAGTVNQVCVMKFTGAGGVWVLNGGTLSSGAPVFVTLS